MVSMQLIDKRGGTLFEHRPDVIPQGFQTDEELSLWAAFFEIRAKAERNG